MAEKRPFLDFKAIKERVQFAAVLARYHIELKRVNNGTLKGACVLPSHTSKSTDTFYVNEAKQVWYCHSESCKTNGHRAGGNVIDFVSAIGNVSAYEAAKLLDEWFPASGNPATETPRKELVSEGNTPLAFTLKGIIHEHPFIQGKGISPATAALYGVGLFSGKGSMAGRIVVPLYESGKLIGYAGRTTLPISADNPKWKLPKGLVKSFLFGIEKCDPAKPLILCESFWGPLWFHEQGHQAASLMGSSLTPEQEKCLEPYSTIVVAMDNDEAGRAASEKLVQRLNGKHKVLKAHLREQAVA